MSHVSSSYSESQTGSQARQRGCFKWISPTGTKTFNSNSKEARNATLWENEEIGLNL